MHTLDVLGDPVRRRILEILLVGGEAPAGAIVAVIRAETGISQPAVSQHLRVLREQGLVTVRAEGVRRLYQLRPGGLAQADAWLAPFREQWASPLAALGTEVARGQRQRRLAEQESGVAAVPDSIRKDTA